MGLRRDIRVHLAALSGLLASACGSSATTSSTTSVGDGGLIDASPAFGAPCVDPRTCASGVCLLFTANAQKAPGICSALCATSSSSGAGCSTAGTCVPVPVLDGGACFPTCSSAAGCAGGLPCVWNATLDAGVCQPLPASFCGELAALGPCEECLGTSCCSQVTACAEDVACSKLDSSCSTNSSCASALQSSGNPAAQGLGACAASSCAVACRAPDAG